MDDNSDKIKKLVDAGLEIVGATVGGAIGLIAGPMGTIGGSVAGVVVSKSLIEFSNRFLSNREQARVGAAAGLTILGIENKIKSGTKLREDGFFDTDEINRSKAEELFEGILIKCKNEYEEKKISYITKLYENVAFETNIKPTTANFILNIAQQLTYRQFAIISMIGDNENNKFGLRDDSYRNTPDLITAELNFLLRDIQQLNGFGIMSRNDKTALISFSDVAPAKMKLTYVGIHFYNFLNLYEMDESEFDFINDLK